MIRHKGYTLIELIIVLALFSLLFSIAIPNYKFVIRYKEQQDIKEFKRDMLYARNRAIVHSEIVDFNFDYSNNGYYITNKSGTLKRYNFKYGIKLVNNTSVTSIRFTRTGTATGNTIYFDTESNHSYKVSVAPITGKIFLEKVR